MLKELGVPLLTLDASSPVNETLTAIRDFLPEAVREVSVAPCPYTTVDQAFSASAASDPLDN
jgi:hypothetical protein